jgi:hypothetical protein
MQRIIRILLFILVCATLLSGFALRRLIAENERLRGNCEALTEDVRLYRTRAGESAASVQALALEISEFRKQHQADTERIRELGIRLRRTESYAKSAMEQRYSEDVVVRDTVILRDTVRIFEGGDRWSRIAGIIAGDRLSYEIHTVDTLHQVVHRVPRKWWFFRFGTRAIRQEIWSSNPHTQLVYSEYVELRRR